MRILVTRPRSQAAEFGDALSSAGFEPVFFPVIEIQPADPVPLDAALKDIERFDWVIFTSVNGVQAVWDRMKALRIPRLPTSLKVAAIGPKTAAALLGHGVSPDYVPEEYVAEAIVPGLGDLTGLLGSAASSGPGAKGPG
jgi:uroporphyrinogen III methyltransferase / synthase